MTASLIVLIALAALTGAWTAWRKRRQTLANRLIRSIARAMESLDRDENPDLGDPCLLAPSRLLLGSAINAGTEEFAQSCRRLAAHASSADRRQTFQLGDATLRKLRDVATHHRHDIVSRA